MRFMIGLNAFDSSNLIFFRFLDHHGHDWLLKHPSIFFWPFPSPGLIQDLLLLVQFAALFHGPGFPLLHELLPFETSEVRRKVKAKWPLDTTDTFNRKVYEWLQSIFFSSDLRFLFASMDWKGVENCLHIKQCWFLLLCSIGSSIPIRSADSAGQEIRDICRLVGWGHWWFQDLPKNVDFKATAVTFG